MYKLLKLPRNWQVLALGEVIFLRQSVFFTCLFFTTCRCWPNLEDTINYSIVDSHNPLSLTSFWRRHTRKVAWQPSRLGLEWVQNWRKWRQSSQQCTNEIAKLLTETDSKNRQKKKKHSTNVMNCRLRNFCKKKHICKIFWNYLGTGKC